MYAKDIWRPVAISHELHIRQAASAHRRHGARLAAAAEAGDTTRHLEQDYKSDLEALREPLAAYVSILHEGSLSDAMRLARVLVEAQVRRLQQLLSSHELRPSE